jgi:hypothetical protein
MTNAYLWSSQVLFAGEVHHKHVGRLHEFLLHTAGRNVDLVFMANARSSASARHLAHPDVSRHSRLTVYVLFGGHRTQPKL